jgi:hypothetical protein
MEPNIKQEAEKAPQQDIKTSNPNPQNKDAPQKMPEKEEDKVPTNPAPAH